MLKRIFDFVCSLIGIIILSPILLLIGAWIKFDSSGPIFFIQNRVGQLGKNIGVFKFRTMVTDAESKGLKITVGNDPRITTSGSFLRKYKLDELAQLINVLNGTMSLVGPRPEVQEFIDFYPDDIRKKVLSVRPGITDFASIEFKNENQILAESADPSKTYIEEILPIKQKYYLKYVEEQNIFLDVQLIFKTIIAIIR
jgi:lipopolysaccharide/colanic/teichoic acid biosynthesis glycosyltransferase